MPLPKSVKVGAMTYAINQAPLTEEGILGRTRHTPQVIDIRRDQGDSAKRDTVLHETLHAVAEAGAMSHLIGTDDESEERLIRFLTPWILGVLRDNPRLVAYLLEK